MDRREWWKYSAACVTGGLLANQIQDVHADTGGSLNAVWVHGTAFTVENETDLVGVDRRGYGTLFRARPQTTNWFHVSIPAPVIIDDQRPLLERVWVLYDATYSVMVKAVHVWDGARQVATFNQIHMSENSWDISPPKTIVAGLGVSVAVAFPQDIWEGPLTKVLFTAAGADFRIPPRIPGGTDPPIPPNPFFRR
jgi:hypothetical protein